MHNHEELVLPDKVTGNGQWKYASNCLLPIEDQRFLGKV